MYIITAILVVATIATIYYYQRRQAKRNKAVYTYSALPLLAFAFVFETWHYVVLGLVGLIIIVSIISIAVKSSKRKKRRKVLHLLPAPKTEPEKIEVAEQAEAQTQQPVVTEVVQTQQEIEYVEVQPSEQSKVDNVVEQTTFTPTESVVAYKEAEPTYSNVQQDVVKESVVANNMSATTATVATKSKTRKSNNESDDTLIRYNKSFTAKVILGDEELRDRYNEIKNYLMSFEGVRARMSWYNETFRYKRLPVAKLALRGKTITLYVALDPQQFVDSAYTVDDCSDVKRYKDFPSAIKLKGPRMLKFAQSMIATRLSDLNTYTDDDYEQQDFRLPYRPFTTLLEDKLIKEIIVHKGTSGVKRLAGAGELILKRVEAEEADELIEDEVAATMVETRHNGVSATGKKGIINIGELTNIYNDGDTVTLQDLKDKKLVARDVERLKVLADGYLDKKLTVEAQDFSMDAVKMIILTGGKVVKVD